MLKRSRRIITFLGLKGAQSIVEILVPLVIARIFVPDIFGSFALTKMMIFLPAAILFGPLFTPFIIESIKEYTQESKSNKTFSSALIYLSIASVLVFLIFIIFGRELLQFAGLDYEQYKSVFVLAFIGFVSIRLLSTAFMSQDKKTTAVLLEFIYYALILSYIFYNNWKNVLELYDVIFAYFIMGMVTLVLFLFFLDFKRLFPLYISAKSLKRIMNFSSWVLLGYASSYLINWGDNIILTRYVSMSDIGVYNLAYQIFKGGLMFFFAINIYFTPFISKHIRNKRIMHQFLFSKKKLLILFSLLMVLIGEFTIHPVMGMFFAGSYLEAAFILQILLVAIFGISLYTLNIPIINVYGKYKYVQIFLIVQVVLNIILDIILVPFFGIVGAAIATVLSYLVFTAAVVYYFNSNIRSKIV